MKNLKTGIDWLDKILPEGIVVPSSTLISGPGGTGKPLIEFAFVAAWLKAGGSLIGIPLQYPNAEMVKTAMQKLYHIDLDDYKNKIVYVQFDPQAGQIEKVDHNILKANMIIPEIWDETIEKAEKMLDQGQPGTMVFGSALNLLLFSKTYEERILNKLREAILKDKQRTYAFAVSTTAKAKEIKVLEDAADNLMFTRMEESMKLFFKIVRMKDVEFSKEEVLVPIPESMFKEINEIAEATRKTRIPEIRGI